MERILNFQHVHLLIQHREFKQANKFLETLTLVNNTSIYALTGSIISTDRAAVELATNALRHAAGNFYINFRLKFQLLFALLILRFYWCFRWLQVAQ